MSDDLVPQEPSKNRVSVHGTVSPNISYEGLLHCGFGDIAALLGRVSGTVQDQLVMDGGD